MEETDGSSDTKLGLDLRLGLRKYEPKKKSKRVFFLDLSSPIHQSDQSSSGCIGFMEENKKQKRKINAGILDEGDVSDSKNCSRKKLRLSKDQITLLEDCFEQHSTLTMAQKQELAHKLNLKPRQVEVWFQNRRARTKLKKTEIDCEFLKKNFERLSEENRRLHNQLSELRSPPAAAARRLFYQMTKEAPIYTACSSCEKIWRSSTGTGEKEAVAEVMGED